MTPVTKNNTDRFGTTTGPRVTLSISKRTPSDVSENNLDRYRSIRRPGEKEPNREGLLVPLPEDNLDRGRMIAADPPRTRNGAEREQVAKCPYPIEAE